MVNDQLPESTDYVLTRQRLAEGTLLEMLRAQSYPGIRVHSDEELEQSLQIVLSGRDGSQDLHVFAYGSLMWNPALDVVETSIAHVRGWHRRFCLQLIFGRGTPELPGVMLALDRGGACTGVLLRIEASKVESELRLLWRREMATGTYEAKWVWADVEGQRILALTFVVNRSHERYIRGDYPVELVARLIRTGKGTLGTARAYFDSTVQALEHLGVSDAGIARLHGAILRADEAHGTT